jgi:hypothetical protein
MLFTFLSDTFLRRGFPKCPPNQFCGLENLRLCLEPVNQLPLLGGKANRRQLEFPLGLTHESYLTTEIPCVNSLLTCGKLRRSVSGMAKCDTSKTPVHLLRYYEDQDTWCRRCFRDFIEQEDDLPNKGCRKCGVIHLAERMFEKIPGWYCRACAREYDNELLKQMLAQEAPHVTT